MKNVGSSNLGEIYMTWGLAFVVPLLTINLLWIETNRMAEISFLLNLIILFLSWGIMRKKPKSLHLIVCIVVASVIDIMLLIWNFCFRSYSENHHYHFDIFRGVFNNFHSPIYGNVYTPFLLKQDWTSFSPLWWPVIVLSFIFLAFISTQIAYLKEKRFFVWGIVFLFLFIIVFTNRSGISGFVENRSHYAEFSYAAHFFHGAGDLLKNYVKLMPQLGIQSPHYPPGNVLLVMLAQWNIFLPKTVIVLSCILTPLTIRFLMKQWHSGPLEYNMAALLFSIAAPVLIFPKMATEPLTMFLVSLAIALYQFMLNGKRQFKAPVLTGIVVAMACFFSFFMIFICFFLFVYTVLSIYKNRDYSQSVYKKILMSIITFVFFYWLVYLLTGFNMMMCFKEALLHRSRIQGYEAYDNWERYLFRSTGNFIAFVFLLGSPLVMLGLLNVKNKENQQTYFFAIALIITILVTSFCGTFFLETERLWMIFIPAIIALAATELARYYSQISNKNYQMIIILFFISMLHSVVCVLLIDHSLGFFL
ncbi:MAG: hypothetical protein HQL26_02045 [Candidatus Omnitrophica bacterium]|nr:hypothetical protein [Candidatus Omnitrophota bacterium]